MKLSSRSHKQVWKELTVISVGSVLFSLALGLALLLVLGVMLPEQDSLSSCALDLLGINRLHCVHCFIWLLANCVQSHQIQGGVPV